MSVAKFGGNTQPPKLGRGELPQPWKCVCGYENPGKTRWTKRGREICRQCMQEREFVEDHGDSKLR